MKRFYLTILTMIFIAFNAQAQKVDFNFSSGYNGVSVSKSVMESTISALLTELNRAGKAHGVPALYGISMEPRTRTRLLALWDNCNFICEDDINKYPCIKDFEGFQVRGIPVEMKPQDSSYRGEKSRELTISFNKRGVITGVSLALNATNAKKIMGNGNAVKDVSERRMIMKFLEDFRCYYNEKDTAALRAIYSDDAIIITGSVVQRKQMGDISANKTEIRYNKQNKEQYMASIKKCFANNKYINVEFDKIDIVRHPARDSFYGVTLHQKWDSSHYKDDGWLFLVWDFSTPGQPTIHVRTWQPWQVQEDDVFNLDDFRID